MVTKSQKTKNNPPNKTTSPAISVQNDYPLNIAEVILKTNIINIYFKKRIFFRIRILNKDVKKPIVHLLYNTAHSWYFPDNSKTGSYWRSKANRKRSKTIIFMIAWRDPNHIQLNRKK